MNTLISYNWLKEFCKTDANATTVAEQLSLVGNEVERTIRPDKYLNKVVVGQIKELSPHPDADKLQLVATNIGGEIVKIVCGGANLVGGQLVAVALPGAFVSWHGEEEVELKETKIRGEESFGMICASEEIGFSGITKGNDVWDLNGIVTEKDVGRPLVEVLELDDTVFDIEVTTNRPDSMAVVGQAREAYAVGLGDMDDPLLRKVVIPEATENKYVFKLSVDEHNLCPRYMGLLLDVEVGPSPWWLQKKLILAGAKPINNVVDVTNYVRIELGQPLHVFDFQKIDGGEIIVRRAKNGEKFMALDEQEYELKDDMLVIADAVKPVAIGGVMGGLDSGVTSDTTTIVLEAATFDPLSIRSTWRALNLQSDSQTLYEKGLSTELAEHGMARAVELLKEVANAKVVSSLHNVQKEEYVPREFVLRPEKVNALIGIEIDTDTQIGMLKRLGFAVSEGKSHGEYKVEVPFWRDIDIEADVDLTEEIARLYGYANLPSTMPTGVIPRRQKDPVLAREIELKNLYSGHGWTELYSNSFIDPEDAKRAGINPSDGLMVKNPLTVQESLMRTSLIPSFMRAVADNENREGVARLFEVQRVYIKRDGDLPEERPMMVVGLVEHAGGEELFRHVKGALDLLATKYHFVYELSKDNVNNGWHPGRSARILVDGKAIGTVGELHPIIVQAFGVEKSVAVLEIDLVDALPHFKLNPTYVEPSEFPVALRDIALLVDEAIVYGDLEANIRSASEFVASIELFDLYRGSQIEKGKKSLAVHLAFSADRTLTSEEVDTDMKKIEKALAEKYNVEIRE